MFREKKTATSSRKNRKDPQASTIIFGSVGRYVYVPRKKKQPQAAGKTVKIRRQKNW
jgi:hypothetical protein